MTSGGREWHRRLRRPQNGVARWGRSRSRRRRRDLVKDVLLDCLQLNGEVARHPPLAGRELADAARRLLLTGGDPIDALPHRVEIERHRVELLLIGRRGGRRGYLAGRVA